MLGTSSSESVLPRMMAKMEMLGCEESVVGLVIPAGYSFNLDGTCIYLTMAARVHRAGDEHPSDAHAPARHARHPAADLEGRGRRDRLGLRHAGRDARLGRHVPRRRPSR